MNFDNLVVGGRYKNYADLMAALGVKPKRGNGKKAQLKIIDSKVDYHKEGHSFIIDGIKEVADEIVDGRSTGNNTIAYLDILEKLILDLMLQDEENNMIYLSKSKMFKQLSLVNDNYGVGKGNMYKLSNVIDIDIKTVEDWYNSTDSMLEGNILKALDALEKKSLIFWNHVYTVDVDVVTDVILVKESEPRYNEKGEELPTGYTEKLSYERQHREATTDEVVIILDAERSVLEYMGCEHKGTVVAKGKWNEFIEKVNEIVKKKGNINYYYQSYKVVFSPKGVKERLSTLEKIFNDTAERQLAQHKVNTGVQDRTVDNAKRRHERARDYFGVAKDHRALVTYVPNSSTLSNTLISTDAPNLKLRLRS